MKTSERILVMLLLVIGVSIKLFFLNFNELIWWDSAVYYGMGKYFFSLGESGLWEPLRPLIWPGIIGFLWNIGFDAILTGKLLGIVLSLSNVFLVYKISNRAFEKPVGIIASLLIMFSSNALFYESKVLSDIPAVFFSLIAIYFWINKTYFLSGFLVGISFMTKFPQVLILIPLTALLVNEPKKLSRFLSAFMIVVLIYFTFNLLMYGDIFLPFKQGTETVEYSGYWTNFGLKYFLTELLRENIFFVFSIIGFLLCFIDYKREKIVIAASALLLSTYFAQLTHNETRFFILFVPFLAILSAQGIVYLLNKRSRLLNLMFIGLFVLFSLNFVSAVQFMQYPSKADNEIIKNYYQYQTDKPLLASSPIFTVYIDKKVELIYYPIFDEVVDGWLNKDLSRYTVAINTCDIPCKENICEVKKKELIDSLIKRKKVELIRGSCTYYVFD